MIVNELLSKFSPQLRDMLSSIGDLSGIEEIRVRIQRPLMLRGQGGEYGLTLSGRKCALEKGYCVTQKELDTTLQLMTENSWYALEDEIRAGYITLPGGHRVGLSGRAVLEHGTIKTLKHINGFNVRLAREVRDAADAILSKVLRGGRPVSSLLVSPPGCGKTTLLRDLARQVGNRGWNVVVVDERSEIAGCYRGQPQLDVGIRTDVLDGCPKAAGIVLALRGLSPQVLVTDEIGHPDDGIALADAARAGVKVIASCHGEAVTTVQQRPWAKDCLVAFEQMILLSRRNGPGTIERVLKLGSGA